MMINYENQNEERMIKEEKTLADFHIYWCSLDEEQQELIRKEIEYV